MNGTMIGVGSCGRKHLGEFTAHRQITAVKTHRIRSDSMRHVIVIHPGDGRSGCYRQACREKLIFTMLTELAAGGATGAIEL